jgi:hypothetical protein
MMKKDRNSNTAWIFHSIRAGINDDQLDLEQCLPLRNACSRSL